MEPVMTVNGVTLTQAQAMTVRVALQSFLFDLGENGLGDDEHGRAMREGYMDRIKEINRIMIRTPLSSTG